jgi:hypothetical protein
MKGGSERRRERKRKKGRKEKEKKDNRVKWQPMKSEKYLQSIYLLRD